MSAIPRQRLNRFLVISTVVIASIASIGAAPAANAASVTPDPLAAVAATGGLGTTASIAASRQSESTGSVAQPTAALPNVTITPAVSASAPVNKIENGISAKVFSTTQQYSFVTGTSPEGTTAAFAVANSASAPSAFKFKIASSSGPVTLDQPLDGYVVVRDATGKEINLIRTPWAVDANGTPLATSYSVSGDVVTQNVNYANAVFPVVADPTVACDALFCTAEFNKAETKAIVDYAPDAATLIVIGCTLLDPIVGFACAGALAVVHITAVSAENQHKCVGWRMFIYTGTQYPVVYSGGNCK